MTPDSPSFAGHRFPAEAISQALWHHVRLQLGLRMVEELQAARDIRISYETVRQWALMFGQALAIRVRRSLPRAGDKWHLDGVTAKISGVQRGLWRAVDQTGRLLVQ